MNELLVSMGYRLMNGCHGVMGGMIHSKLIYTISLNNIVYGIMPGILKVFPDLVEDVLMTNGSNVEGGYKLSYKSDIDNSASDRNISTFITYKGTPIIFQINKVVSNEDGSRRSWRSDVFLTTLRTSKNVKNVKNLIKYMVEYSMAKMKNSNRERDIKYFTGNKRWGETISYVKLRTFDDVYIDNNDKNRIIDSVNKFINKRDWYNKHNIPYHFGILLYGPPGTGKSTIAQAITKYIDAELRVVSGDNVLDIPEYMSSDQIPRNTFSPDIYQVILIEDIDCGISEKNRYELYDSGDGGSSRITNDRKAKGLASVLNALDGIASPSNTIFIYTTNHVNNLDPALLRPGRVDLAIEIGYINRNIFDEFCMNMYGEKSNEDFEIKDNMTIALLQTQVMKGMSLNELVAEVRKEV